jgi:DNA modification methylase
VDIFSGSNTTGFVAEAEGRNWLAFEREIQYIAASSFRFMDKNIDEESLSLFYEKVMSRESVEIIANATQLSFLETAAIH